MLQLRPSLAKMRSCRTTNHNAKQGPRIFLNLHEIHEINLKTKISFSNGAPKDYEDIILRSRYNVARYIRSLVLNL